MPTPPQIVNQVMEAVNPLWNSNTNIHIGSNRNSKEGSYNSCYAFGAVLLPMTAAMTLQRKLRFHKPTLRNLCVDINQSVIQISNLRLDSAVPDPGFAVGGRR